MDSERPLPCYTCAYQNDYVLIFAVKSLAKRYTISIGWMISSHILDLDNWTFPKMSESEYLVLNVVHSVVVFVVVIVVCVCLFVCLLIVSSIRKALVTPRGDAQFIDEAYSSFFSRWLAILLAAHL